MGDIIGDWREEVILAKQGDNSSTGLVGYTTAMPTSYSIYCLQQDPHYRGDCTTRGYYQHPNTGFYLGGDMPMPPLPPVYEADLRWKGSSTTFLANTGVTAEDGFTSFDMTQFANYADGKSLMFDIAGNNSKRIYVDKPFNAPTIYLMNPRGHDYELCSAHLGAADGIVTTGSGQLIKSMQGKVSLAGWLRHTGKTIISEGTLHVNGDIAGPVELRAKGTLSGSVTLKDTITFEGALNHEGCRLMPGNDEDSPLDGVITSKKSMTLPGDVYLEVTAGFIGNSHGSWPMSSCISVEGDLTFKNTNYITVNLWASNNAAEYVIAECTGTLTCDPSKLQTRGLEGINYDLVVKDKKLVLIINTTREASNDVAWTGNEDNNWNYKGQNFDLNGATSFVAGDGVVFASEGQQTINVDEMMVTQGVTFDGGKWKLQGEGGISGQGGVTVCGNADVTLNMKYSDYTGATTVKDATLTVPNFYDGGQKSALGAASASLGNLVLENGTLVLSQDNMGTDRQISVKGTSTIRIAQSNSALSLKGQVKGAGYLVKDGAGQLNFTYGGTNAFAGLTVKKGIVAQGAWNATFGSPGSPMILAGGEVHQIDHNNTSQVPNLDHAITVEEGTTNKIVGSSRGKISGSIKGKGNLTIQTRYVRCDIGSDFSNFEGTLTAIGDGGNFRLMSNVTNMAKTRLVLGAGTNMAHFVGGSNTSATATTRIGSLSGTATDGILGGSGSTYQVGDLGEDTQFSGLFQCARVIKSGTGKLTLRTPGHTAPITVSGGTLELNNSGSDIMTSGLITVGKNAMLTGNALASNVTINSGGTVSGGTSILAGTLRISENLTLQKGSTVLCRLTASANTRLSVSGNIKHNGDTILVRIPANRVLNEGDVITVFTSGTQTGTYILKVESEGMDYEFDDSTLLSDGKLRVKSVTTAIASAIGNSPFVDVYTTDGRKVLTRVPRSQALSLLPSGIYVINGQKVIK
jgi:autotransporter-associated beta strand protein